MRPTLLPVYSTNHSAPSGPAVISHGSLATVGMGNSLKIPSVVIRPILLTLVANSVNHSAPSGPTPSPDGILPRDGVGHSARRPLVVVRPILLFQFSVIHRLPSGPGMTCARTLSGIGAGYWLVITPLVVMRTVRLPPFSLNQIAPSGPAAIPEGP